MEHDRKQIKENRAFKKEDAYETLRFLYKGIIINHKKTEPTYIKRRFLTKDGVFTSDGRNALSGHPPMVDKAARQNLMPYFWTKCPEVVLCL